jgi:fumigaclavine B O-acetyltransferase
VDHSLPKVYIFKILYFQAVDFTCCLSLLQDGVDRLVSYLPFLTGEVAPCTALKGKTGVQQIQMPGPSLKELPMLLVKYYPDRILPKYPSPSKNSAESKEGTSSPDQSYRPLPDFIPASQPRPVLRFQANFLADGLVLCMGYNHSVFDGTGAGTILEMLADCCRAGAASDISLITTSDIESELRGFLSSASVAVPKDSQAEYAINCAHTEVETQSFPTMLCNYPFLLSSDRIERLRDACNGLLPYVVETYSRAQTSPVNNDGKWPDFLSSNDVLTALLAISVKRAREAAPSPQPRSTSLAMAVNLRERLKSVPSHYLGNLVTTVWASHLEPPKRPEALVSTCSTCEQLEIEMDDLLWIVEVAFRVRLGLNSIDEEHACGLIHYLHSQDDWEKIGIHFTDPVFVSSWRHLKVYRLDFGPGIGRIQNFEMDVGTSDGNCIVMPADFKKIDGKNKRPQWEVRLILNQEAMDALINDSLFSWARIKGTFE